MTAIAVYLEMLLCGRVFQNTPRQGVAERQEILYVRNCFLVFREREESNKVAAV
jgi:hypothetical protein